MRDSFLQQRYDEMWSQARERIRAGTVEIDPQLARREADQRRGITLLVRPTRRIQLQVKQLLDRLRAFEPGQHYYHLSELHMTFLSPFTATVEHEPFFARTREYVTAIRTVVGQIAPFTISFTGITASPSTILIQGFTDPATLNAARDALRHELRARDLAQSLDSRYHLETAHMSVVRFKQPLREGALLATELEQARQIEFGEMRVESMELVENDWYMSRDCTKCLRRYLLGQAETGMLWKPR